MSCRILASIPLAISLLAQTPPAPPAKIKLQVGSDVASTKAIELASGTYISLGMSCSSGVCTVTVNGSSSSIPGTVNFSGADHTIVAKVGTVPPATCTVGEWFFDSDEPAGQNLKLCTSTNTWTSLTATATVASVFGRTGAVVAQAGDYTASLITNTPSGGIAATTVQAAINELDTEKAASAHTHAASDVTTGTFNTARLGSGTPGSTTFLRGDSSWASVGWTDVSGKPTTFPPSSHTHVVGDLTQSGATTGQVLKWNGSQWSPGTDETGGGSGAPNYSQSFTSQTTVNLTHNLGTSNVIVSCYDSSDTEIIPQAVTIASANAVTVNFNQATTGRCVVNGSGGGGGGSGTVYTGTGLTGDGSAADPVRIDPVGAVASQTYFTAGLNFPGIAAASCAELNIPASGVIAGVTIAPGWPSLPAGIVGMMYSGTGVVVVRLCNITSSGIDPPSATFSARVIGGF